MKYQDVQLFNRKFAEAVKAARLKIRMTQEQLAKAIDVSPSFVALIEEARVSVVLQTAIMIAQAVGVELRNLIPS